MIKQSKELNQYFKRHNCSRVQINNQKDKEQNAFYNSQLNLLLLTLNIYIIRYLSSFKKKSKMNKIRQQQQIYSDDELNEQINDKLSELWTGMKNKRKQMIRNLTPSYSRRSQRTLSELDSTQNQNLKFDDKKPSNQISHNQTGHHSTNLTGQNTYKQTIYNNQTQYNNLTTQNQLLKVKQKLASQQSARKSRQNQIQRLKNTISQLSNDKKILFSQLKNITNNSVSICNLNQSSIHHAGFNDNNKATNDTMPENNHITSTNVDGKTASFSTNKKKSHGNKNQIKKDKSYTIINELGNKQNRMANRQNSLSYNKNSESNKKYRRQSQKQMRSLNRKQETQQDEQLKRNLQDLSKTRLIQLLKSTTQYRQFAFYYDSHQLSYLKRLQLQHKKNCSTNHSKIQQKYWAPTQLIQVMKNFNRKNKINLSQTNIQQIVGEMKHYFETIQELKIKDLKDHYLRKIQKLKRQKTNNVHYDLVRLSNAKEREISQIYTKKNKSIRQ